jgi:hypothetical protein
MNDPDVTISLEGHQRIYGAGDVLSAECRIQGYSLAEPRALEVSVLWYTEGKGEEDLSVHYFNRLAGDQGAVDLRRPYSFSTRLPNSPLSYDGLIVKIRWCVRARLFLARGREIVAEEVFRLGHIPAAAMVTPHVETSTLPASADGARMPD